MPYSAVEIAEYGRKIGKSRSTLFKWIQEGCDLRDPKSVAEWVTRNTIRETNISKARKLAVTTNRRPSELSLFRIGTQLNPPPMVRHCRPAEKALRRLWRGWNRRKNPLIEDSKRHWLVAIR
jgi:hypothetical protein